MGGARPTHSCRPSRWPSRNTTLANTVATVFKGETLRSMLLNAYGWWKVSQITYIASLALFGLGTVSFLASLFGFGTSATTASWPRRKSARPSSRSTKQGTRPEPPPDNRGADVGNVSAPAGQRASRGSAPRSISARRSGAGGQRGWDGRLVAAAPPAGTVYPVSANVVSPVFIGRQDEMRALATDEVLVG